MGFSGQGLASTTPQPVFIPSVAFPSGLTLLEQYTASASGLSFSESYGEYLFVVAVSGGGAGGVSNNSADVSAMGGGSGGLLMGWILTSELTSVIVGAGTSTASAAGGATELGTSIIIPGGAGGIAAEDGGAAVIPPPIPPTMPGVIYVSALPISGGDADGVGAVLPSIGPVTSSYGAGSVAGRTAGIASQPGAVWVYAA